MSVAIQTQLELEEAAWEADNLGNYIVLLSEHGTCTKSSSASFLVYAQGPVTIQFDSEKPSGR